MTIDDQTFLSTSKSDIGRTEVRVHVAPLLLGIVQIQRLSQVAGSTPRSLSFHISLRTPKSFLCMPTDSDLSMLIENPVMPGLLPLTLLSITLRNSSKVTGAWRAAAISLLRLSLLACLVKASSRLAITSRGTWAKAGRSDRYPFSLMARFQSMFSKALLPSCHFSKDALSRSWISFGSVWRRPSAVLRTLRGIRYLPRVVAMTFLNLRSAKFS